MSTVIGASYSSLMACSTPVTMPQERTCAYITPLLPLQIAEAPPPNNLSLPSNHNLWEWPAGYIFSANYECLDLSGIAFHMILTSSFYS